jgi:hypothetical protein
MEGNAPDLAKGGWQLPPTSPGDFASSPFFFSLGQPLIEFEIIFQARTRPVTACCRPASKQKEAERALFAAQAAVTSVPQP